MQRVSDDVAALGGANHDDPLVVSLEDIFAANTEDLGDARARKKTHECGHVMSGILHAYGTKYLGDVSLSQILHVRLPPCLKDSKEPVRSQWYFGTDFLMVLGQRASWNRKTRLTVVVLRELSPS